MVCIFPSETKKIKRCLFIQRKIGKQRHASPETMRLISTFYYRDWMHVCQEKNEHLFEYFAACADKCGKADGLAGCSFAFFSDSY